VTSRVAYLHGFASGPRSRKGSTLAAAFAERGVRLQQPDLNRPDFAHLTYTGMLAATDALDAHPDSGEGRWGLIGSSMGGWVAARWAELHPAKVARLLLLAPGFDLPNRWRQLISEQDLAAWEAAGWREVADADGVPTRLGWALMEDARRQPPVPRPSCPVLLLHGRRDEVVPLEVSEAFARGRPNVELEVLDDDHDLLATLPRIVERALGWFGALAPADRG
jgi:pimeloyl-ACP methyl ester carboxylesterase